MKTSILYPLLLAIWVPSHGLCQEPMKYEIWRKDCHQITDGAKLAMWFGVIKSNNPPLIFVNYASGAGYVASNPGRIKKVGDDGNIFDFYRIEINPKDKTVFDVTVLGTRTAQIQTIRPQRWMGIERDQDFKDTEIVEDMTTTIITRGGNAVDSIIKWSGDTYFDFGEPGYMEPAKIAEITYKGSDFDRLQINGPPRIRLLSQQEHSNVSENPTLLEKVSGVYSLTGFFSHEQERAGAKPPKLRGFLINWSYKSLIGEGNFFRLSEQKLLSNHTWSSGIARQTWRGYAGKITWTIEAPDAIDLPFLGTLLSDFTTLTGTDGIATLTPGVVNFNTPGLPGEFLEKTVNIVATWDDGEAGIKTARMPVTFVRDHLPAIQLSDYKYQSQAVTDGKDEDGKDKPILINNVVGRTMGTSGCTITTLAIIFNRPAKKVIEDLNKFAQEDLISNEPEIKYVFNPPTSPELEIYNAVSRLSNRESTFHSLENDNLIEKSGGKLMLLDRLLELGFPVIVKVPRIVKTTQGNAWTMDTQKDPKYHYVLVTGRTAQGDYEIMDVGHSSEKFLFSSAYKGLFSLRGYVAPVGEPNLRDSPRPPEGGNRRRDLTSPNLSRIVLSTTAELLARNSSGKFTGLQGMELKTDIPKSSYSQDYHGKMDDESTLEIEPSDENPLESFQNILDVYEPEDGRLDISLNAVDAGIYGWSGLAYNAVGDATSISFGPIALAAGENRNFVVKIDGTVESGDNEVDAGYDSWIQTHFSTMEIGKPGISGYFDDPDKDNSANLIEYAFGLNPKKSDPPLIITPKPEYLNGQLRHSISFVCPQKLPDHVQVFVATSTDLENWANIASKSADSKWEGSAVIGISQGLAGTETVKVTPDSSNMPLSRGLYLRVGAAIER